MDIQLKNNEPLNIIKEGRDGPIDISTRVLEFGWGGEIPFSGTTSQFLSNTGITETQLRNIFQYKYNAILFSLNVNTAYILPITFINSHDGSGDWDDVRVMTAGEIYSNSIIDTGAVLYINGSFDNDEWELKFFEI